MTFNNHAEAAQVAEEISAHTASLRGDGGGGEAPGPEAGENEAEPRNAAFDTGFVGAHPEGSTTPNAGFRALGQPSSLAPKSLPGDGNE